MNGYRERKMANSKRKRDNFRIKSGENKIFAINMS